MMEGSHFPALYLTDEIGLIQGGGVGFHTAENGMERGGVVVGSRKGDQAVVLGVHLPHSVDEILIGGVVDLHGVYVAGEQADVVDIARLAEGVSLHDEGTRLGHEGEHVGFLHGLDLGMLQIPGLIQAVDQEVRPAVGAFHAEKHGYADLLPQLHSLFVVGEVEFDPLLIRLGSVAVDIAVDEVVGDENTCISQLLVIFQSLPHACRGTAAHGGGVKVGFVEIGLHRGTAFRVVGFSIA